MRSALGGATAASQRAPARAHGASCRQRSPVLCECPVFTRALSCRPVRRPSRQLLQPLQTHERVVWVPLNQPRRKDPRRKHEVQSKSEP